MSFLWFAYNIAHDIRVSAQCIDFKKNLNIVPILKSSKKNIFISSAYHVLSNLLRWHATVFRMTIEYVRTRTFQLDYLVEKSNNIIFLLNYTSLIPY